MTKEDTREAIWVMTQYLDGKTIQDRTRSGYNDGRNLWIDDPNPSWNWSLFEYRVKPEPKYRPWTPEEGVGKVVRTQSGAIRQLVAFADGSFLIPIYTSVIHVTPITLLQDGYTQLDGSPCGVLEGGEQ